MGEKSTNEEKLKSFTDAIGAIAEMTLIFYRDILSAGATPEESLKLTQAFIASFLGSANQKNPEETV